MSEVLIVDDEPLVLDGYYRQLRDRFRLRTAQSAEEGLTLFETEGPFAVVVADMMMPGMNGARFLSKIRRMAPETMRVMLTGCQDRDTAIQAINEGNVHRFHTKPCTADELAITIQEAVSAHRQQAEQRYGVQRLLAESDELEEELTRARQRAQSAELARKAILATVGHELRTPLNHVIGLSDMMRSGLSSQLKATEYAADIHRSGSELHEKIENILTLAQLDSGDLYMDEECFSLRSFVEDCVDVMTDAAYHGGIAIRLDLPRFRVMVRGDLAYLARSLLNLLSNAIKFSARDTEITIRARVSNDGGLVISVLDRGVGFSQDELAVAVEPFSQGDSRLERCFEGLGLGLPLAQTLIECHGGCLVLEGARGEGATVSLCLPRSRVSVKQDSQSAA